MTQIRPVVFFTVLLSVPLFSGSDSNGSLRILPGSPIHADGKIQPGEWDDAQFVEIAIAPDWVVKVGAKYGAEDLNFHDNRGTAATQLEARAAERAADSRQP